MKNNIEIKIEPEALEISSEYRKLMDNFEFAKAFDLVWEKIQTLNKRINDEKPWELAKNHENKKLQQCLTTLINDLLQANVELSPFIPDTCKKIEAVFESPIRPPKTPLFPKG